MLFLKGIVDSFYLLMDIKKICTPGEYLTVYTLVSYCFHVICNILRVQFLCSYIREYIIYLRLDVNMTLLTEVLMLLKHNMCGSVTCNLRQSWHVMQLRQTVPGQVPFQPNTWSTLIWKVMICFCIPQLSNTKR